MAELLLVSNCAGDSIAGANNRIIVAAMYFLR
jgi:hypothetical protein